jgi:hypothetical protein
MVKGVKDQRRFTGTRNTGYGCQAWRDFRLEVFEVVFLGAFDFDLSHRIVTQPVEGRAFWLTRSGVTSDDVIII